MLGVRLLKQVNIVYTKHSIFKFEILAKHGFSITKEQIEDTIQQPDKLMVSEMGRLIAQKAIDKTHLIRVIYIRKDDEVKVITFYPTRRQRYEY